MIEKIAKPAKMLVTASSMTTSRVSLSTYKTWHALKVQYTPPMPTRLDCRVESHRRCVYGINSQLVVDSLDESE